MRSFSKNNLGKRNLRAGKNFERKLISTINLRTIGNKYSKKDINSLDDSLFHILPKLGSTRRLSTYLDSNKVDITVENPARIKEFPYVFQAKSSIHAVQYLSLIKEIGTKRNKNEIPVIAHQFTEKKGEKFYTQEEFAILKLKDFIDIIFELAELKFQLKQEEHFKK